MKSIQALRERKIELARQANHILAEKGDQTWSKDDQTKYDGLMDEMERVSGQINAHQRMLDAEADNFFTQRPAPKIVDGDIGKLAAVALYMRHGNDVTPEQAVAIRNAMSTTTAAEGGFTVPTEVAKMVIDALKAYGGMRDVATILTTDSGAALNYPASDGTAEEGEIVGENAPATSGDITFSQVPLNPFKYSSKKIALPIELIQDSAIDVIAFVVNRLATRLGRITNKHYTIGTGTGQPWGIVNRASAGKVGITGQTLTMTYDDIADLYYSVNRAYRSRASFSMADLSLRNIRKIKDTAGRPIFTPSYEAGITQDAPDLLMGKPIRINDDVPVMAANAKSILFGDHSQYTIRDVAGSTAIRRFDDSAFALNAQVGFCGWQRTGGNLLDTAAVKYYQNSAT